MASAAKPILQSAIGGVALGGFLYLVGDTASDYLTYSKLRAAALQLAEGDEELKQLLGQPYTTGYWYNSTLGFSHQDKVAHCSFQLLGSKRVTDIAVKAGRQQGPKSNVLYNIIGPGTWRLISCQAMVPSEGGLVQPLSLLPEHREERQQLFQQQQQRRQGGQMSSGAGLSACQPCQQQQQAGGQVASSKGSGSWKWWPWGRGSKSAGDVAAATPGGT